MRIWRRCLSGLIGLVLIVTAFVVYPVSVQAETLAVVVTVNDPLSLRSGPGTNHTILTYIPRGSVVTLLDNSNPSWYYVRYNGTEGYASSTYLSIVSTNTGDDFEAYLTLQGFPESYKNNLRVLHALHPRWIFVAKRVGLNFEDALAAECAVGRSLTSYSYSIGSELSFDQGAYNFDTNQHVVYDSGGWVMASRELVAYALDPRNYLTNDYVFAFMSMLATSAENYEGVAGIAGNSFLSAAYPEGLKDSAYFATYLDAILAASRDSGISAYHLTSYILQEQGASGTELSFGTMPGYEGYFNFLNIGAYKTSTMSARERGAATAKSKGWNTPYQSILGGAKFLMDGYISAGQNTGYLKKFDLIADGGYYNHQYMSNIKAAFTEAVKLASAYHGVINYEYTFEIPVFDNMPETPCPKPTATGSNNNVLKSLSVAGQTLTPSFGRYTYSYDLIVESHVEAIDIAAVAYDSSAVIAGVGTVPLAQGSNTLPVVVTAASGTTRTYTLSVYRQPGGSPSPDLPLTINGAYNIGMYITGIAPGTNAADFITALGVQGGDVTLQTASGEAKSGLMATGDRVLISQNGEVKLTYIVVIYGDVNGDGKISTVDLFMGQRYILGISALTNEQATACDINRDGKVSTVDLFMGQRHILGIAAIVQ